MPMAGKEELVSGDGWISDDSSFYGDEETKVELEEFSLLTYSAQDLLNCTPRINGLTLVAHSETQPRSQESRQLYNSREGNEEARQLAESVSDFLARLPPAKTQAITTGPWIWIENPYVPANERRNADLASLGKRGLSLLQEYLSKKEAIEAENPGMVKGSITRKLGPHREALKRSITELALETGCVTGKWMLFPVEEEIPRFWRIVAEAVSDDRLGISAKIATADSDGDTARPRLICVYTKDFSDINDVRRVLEELVGLGLVSDNSGRGIYYKADAYSHLGIESANDFGLRASLYSSREMLSTKLSEQANSSLSESTSSRGRR